MINLNELEKANYIKYNSSRKKKQFRYLQQVSEMMEKMCYNPYQIKIRGRRGGYERTAA